jgi:predicted  nucleic acid-binding Zn-ribbon protein
MALDLRPLIKLHYLDQQISGLQQRISGMPVAIQELDRKLERHKKNLQTRQQSITENQKKRKELESDLALIESKRNRYKEQLDSVKTNKEYTALQHEIEGVNQAIRQIEDEILVQMEDAERLKMQVDEARRALEQEEGVILGEKQVVQSQADKLQAEIDGLKQQRDSIGAQIQEPVMEVYERARKSRRGIAMAEARSEICQECHVRIRPQLFQEIKRNDSIITCESCSRILFYGVDENTVDEQTDGAGNAVRS